jgi:tetratricopeptide (TPR) repeat protein
MALRITGASSAVKGPPSAADLAARAQAALTTRDLAGYRALFGAAGEQSDPNRAYQARRVLIEQALAACQTAPPAQCIELFTEVARAAVEALEREPREPVLLNYAGVAFYELWSLDAAKALFHAAQRLDPSLPQVRRNLAELRRRRRAGNSQRPPSWSPAALAELARRAKRAAARAQPRPGMTLSLCMIVRDEEAMLGRCLEAAAPAVDEIIVVDTGSKDRTVEIARSYGAIVVERAWNGSFADARNISLDAATGDWVMYLDADEVLGHDQVAALQALKGRTWREAFYLVETNHTGEAAGATAMTSIALRVFRNRPEYRFEGRIHEQIVHRLPSYLPERFEHTPIHIEHYGYLKHVRDAKQKSRRNIELLEAQMRESAPTSFTHFNLGSEYAAINDMQAAVNEFEQAWAMVRPELEVSPPVFSSLLAVRLVRALRSTGRYGDAIASGEEALEHFPGLTDIVFEQAAAARAAGRDADAIERYERCIAMGDAPAKYAAERGCGTFFPRILLAELYLGQGRIDDARALLEWCLRIHPEFHGAIAPYVSLLLATGVDAADLVAETERQVADLDDGARFEFARALHQAGAATAAEAEFRRLLAGGGAAGSPVRVELGEALLSQRRYGEAAAEATTVADDDDLAVSARRTELFARTLADDLDGARQARERARVAGVPDDELELFAAWADLLAGEQPPALSVTAAILLGIALDLLLRVQDFDAFERVLPLLHESELAPREQREQLAGLYLKRGFLQSAAREWMDICAQRPDDRAMLGLARVAAAHGLPEDAVTFATEALALNPRNEDARALVAAA